MSSNSKVNFHSIVCVWILFAAPDPPSNLSVSVKSGKSAVISLSPPSKGNFSSFKLRVSTVKYWQNIKWWNIQMSYNSIFLLSKWYSFRYWVCRIISLQIEPFPLKPMSCNTMYAICRLEPATKFKHLPCLIIGNHWRTLVAILQQVSPKFFNSCKFHRNLKLINQSKWIPSILKHKK